MDGVGLLVVTAFVLLTLAIVMNSCSGWWGSEGFVGAAAVPAPTSLAKKEEVKGLSSVADLPSAPIGSLAETNSRPFQDPALEKASRQMINELKQDMDGFVQFEFPHLENRSDPAVKLPLTRLQGDYQRIKDELRVLTQTPGIQAQLTVDAIDNMAANLRFLQRTYRTYAAAQMVPAPKSEEVSKVGLTELVSKEGFVVSTGTEEPITPDQVSLLTQKLAVEIARLQASGSTDPVLQARVNVFTKMRQAVVDIDTRLKNGTMAAKDIPIKVSDYYKFLPALGDSSAGIGGLLSRSGYSTLSSLFNSYDAGDASGSDIAAALLESYADQLLKGLSYSLTLSYTSPNDVAKAEAMASVASAGFGGSGIGHPGTLAGSRGQFDAITRSYDLAGFTTETAPAAVATAPGVFDWKERAESIVENIKKADLNPADFGALPAGAQVSKDFSWRGYTKMICSRLATHSDPGMPEQMGCPPVSWAGWRT